MSRMDLQKDLDKFPCFECYNYEFNRCPGFEKGFTCVKEDCFKSFLKIKDLFSAFKVEYDRQVHVDRRYIGAFLNIKCDKNPTFDFCEWCHKTNDQTCSIGIFLFGSRREKELVEASLQEKKESVQK